MFEEEKGHRTLHTSQERIDLNLWFLSSRLNFVGYSETTWKRFDLDNFSDHQIIDHRLSCPQKF